MTALIITEWAPTDPASPGFLSHDKIVAVLDSDNVDGKIPAAMYDRAQFSAMREMFAMNYVFTQTQTGIIRYVRVKGDSSLYTIMAFDTMDNAAAYPIAAANAAHYLTYESVRDQFLALIKVRMIVHPMVDTKSQMTVEQLDALTEHDLLAFMTA